MLGGLHVHAAQVSSDAQVSWSAADGLACGVVTGLTFDGPKLVCGMMPLSKMQPFRPSGAPRVERRVMPSTRTQRSGMKQMSLTLT
jgi:hypothetical protein